MEPFFEQLTQAVRARGTALVVGLDPRAEQLPRALQSQAQGGAADELPAATTRFCCEVIDAVADLVPAVKPQAAFFERLGPPGMQALADVIRYARSSGLLVILDAKRGDIGSTAEAYAASYLGSQSPWAADALTLNPYLGDDSLEPFVRVARDQHAGLFVLVKTSNPGSGIFQDRLIDGQPLYAHVAHYVEQVAARTASSCGYGVMGAVVGGTYRQTLAELRARMPHAWILVPGYGAQGASAADVAAAFDAAGLGAVVNSSRAIIFAYGRAEFRARFDDRRWSDTVREAARQAIEELRDAGAGPQ